MKPGGRIVFGIGPVRELLRAARPDVSALWLSRGRAERGRGARDPLAELADLARRHDIAVDLRDAAELDALAGPGAVHQGVVAVAGAYRYAEIEDLADRAVAAGADGLLVALDGVTDPHNLGAIARSAHALGAHGLIVPRDRAAAVTPAVTKASAGAIEHLAVAQVTNLARALEQLKQAGLWTAALAAGPGARPLWQMDTTSPLCLVAGAEGRGIRPLVARNCDFQLEIPMRAGGVGSLNVSVATGIALYEIERQRSARRE
ncbi:MAG TPA: 23S rRNA (guanosine(2251)-2'-O)-methyltransferase RlmB [Kofleriaceae bacterium]|nr:23S rRNA (guanosine(2251)-2'-O)-methyltransferase RlmB [Kofleriaceae bacterium]